MSEIDLHERLARLEESNRNQNDSILKLISAIEKHCESDSIKTETLNKRIIQLENISFGGKVLFKFVLGCVMIGGTVFAFARWFHDILGR